MLGQSIFVRHCTHVFIGLQSGVVPLQLVLPVHCTQTCVTVSQTGVVPPQFALDWQEAWQVPRGVQMSPLGQLDALRHCTHAPAGSQ